jgi:hypothetical protein
MNFRNLACLGFACEYPRMKKERAKCLAKGCRAISIRLNIGYFFLNDGGRGSRYSQYRAGKIESILI